MTTLNDNHDSISKGLQKLAHGESMPWTEVSVLLDQVDKTGYWEQTANSFTDWLKSNAEKLGNKESTLWRYLVVGRYYHDLREQFARVHLEYPPLLELPKHVSPEKLELLSKLGRVAPKDFFEKLIYDVLDNEITRDDIRDQWKAFRPAMQGKTSRGRKALIPSVNMKNKDACESIQDAIIINALKVAGSLWLSNEPAQIYSVKIIVDINTDPKFDLPLIPAVILWKTDGSNGLEIHCVETLRNFSFTEQKLKWLEHLSSCCDYLWVAKSNSQVKSTHSQVIEEYYPECVGVILVEADDISVVRKATPTKKDLANANELLKALLLKESR